MASKTGMFLKEEERVSLIQELNSKGELKEGDIDSSLLGEALKSDPVAATTTTEESFGTGCLMCGEDDDHANLLLCEACNDEYHTYCLDPPLRCVPAGDWYCDKCKMPSFEDDGLDKLVNALPPSCTSRFGEVCWAQGGVGFGWWPAFIYDPRLTVGNARQLARKNLGKRHLVYFFECHDAPFACLTDSKMAKWEDGLLEDYHLGKTARAAGKTRTQVFQQALQAATVEAGKPVEMRMDWNHTDQPQILQVPPPPKQRQQQRQQPSSSKKTKQRGRTATTTTTTSKKISSMVRGRNGGSGGNTAVVAATIEPEQTSSSGSKRKRKRSLDKEALSGGAASSSFSSPYSTSKEQQISTRKNLTRAIEALAAAGTAIENEASAEDGELFCKLLRKVEIRGRAASSRRGKKPIVEVGFIKVPSRKTSTFADVRVAVMEELEPDCIPSDLDWKFFVPTLGPISAKQETTLGPVLKFLKSTTSDVNLGNGSLFHPLKILIADASILPSTSTSSSTDEPKNDHNKTINSTTTKS